MQSKNFICFSYFNIDFYILSENVSTSFFQDKIIKIENSPFLDNKSVINFDFFAEKFLNKKIENVKNYTSIVFKKSEIFENNSEFTLLTSSKCKILEKPLSDFEVFSDFYQEFFLKIGIIAVTFISENVGFLIDLENLLINFKNIGN